MVVIQWLYSSRALLAQTRNPSKLFNFANNIKHIGIYHYWQKSKQLLSKDQGKCHLKRYSIGLSTAVVVHNIFMSQQPKSESPFHYLLIIVSVAEKLLLHT